MKTLKRSILACFVAALLVAGCDHADPDDGPGNQLEPTLASIQANIFTTTCAVSGCHIGGGTVLPGAMTLSAGQARGNTVGVPSIENPDLSRIAPGDPDNSYLVWKIEGRAQPRMPLGRAPLSGEQIGVIRQWIADGAPDN